MATNDSTKLDRANVVAQLRSALERFTHEPTRYALRPAVKAALEAMAAAADDDAAAAEAAEGYNDKLAYQEGEAMYILALQRHSCQRVLESASYKVAAGRSGSAQQAQQSQQAQQAQQGQEPAAAEAAAAANGGSGAEEAGGTGAGAGAAEAAGAAAEAAARAAAFRGHFVQDTLAAVTAALHAAEDFVAWRNAAAAAAGRLASRMDRLVALLQLSPKEGALLRYVLYSQASQEDVAGLLAVGELRMMRMALPPPHTFVGMTTQEFLAFMSSERRHIKEGLLPDCSKALLTGTDMMNAWGGMVTRPNLALGLEAVKLLIGESLSQEELLKIDKTALIEVLAEEPGFSREAHTFGLGHGAGAGGASGGAGGRDGTSLDPLAVAGRGVVSGGEGLDLYELIKAEVRRDTSAAAAAAAAVSGPRGLGDLFDDVAADAKAERAAKRQRLAAATGGGGGGGGGATPGGEGGDGGDGDEAMEDAEGGAGGAFRGLAGGAAPAAGPAGGVASSKSTKGGKKGELRPYTSDLEYLESCFKLLMTELLCGKHRRVLANSEEGHDGHGIPPEDYDYDYVTHRGNAKARAAQQVRELEGRERLERSRIEARLRLTAAAREADGQPPWRPRLERLAEARSLAPFEKKVLLLLVGCRVSPTVARTLQACVATSMYASSSGNLATVGNLLLAFHPDDLGEQINARRFFYKSGRLIEDGILTLHGTDFSKDIMEQGVDIDRRMLDFLVGLDTEFSDMVDGSHLYFPGYVRLEDVVLPAEQKQLIVETVENFSRFKKARAALGMDGSSAGGGGGSSNGGGGGGGSSASAARSSGPGGGLVLLFHGASGVGKTMMANAVAHHVGKKVLLINFPSLGQNQAGEVVRFIFREAKIHDALLFFDECEAIFEDRDKGSHAVNMLLTEIERYDGLVVMATNRPHDIDEAMHRRITMAFEFRRPDHLQRLEIWKKQLPPACKLEPDVDLPALALKFELSGGYIRNAVQAALSKATSRCPEGVAGLSLRHSDLQAGAALQLRGALRLKDQDRQRVPRRGLDDVLLPASLKEKLEKVVQHEKARAVLVGQWGFGSGGDLSGTVCLFHGPPGTGKTLAAEAVGYETGRPLKVVNCAGLVSKWVGDTPKNIDALFADARATDAVLVFDEAEGLFGSRPTEMGSASDRYAAMDVGVLLFHLETHPGIVVLITNQPAAIDKAFHRRIRFMMNFPMPDAGLRAKLWRAAVPQQTPLAGEVDWKALGDRHELSGGAIRNAVIRAATRAALRVTSAGAAAGGNKPAAATAAGGGAAEDAGARAAQERGTEGAEQKATANGAAAVTGVSMADLQAEADEEVTRGDGDVKQQVRAMYM
ncbi:hypothetical protein HXX76_007801 [Chlamydomonas incerta]|uniref:AAA+ ATPase domain-containing protein n=1 Tax=Chlamydomonas incerta TaxID=51695 RepID=A0A835T1E1_CHLIN|nr:hypothetical protein HXX76_007801 [Chlamydomonas incerta]|eukprot:KAG2434073.1 hypothetical protein HXX76_007801 [Chlamydomonas incerta]